ncbi:hypothetical protein [Burkholderia metallica]|uniref:hypothetical protein n=1 Tax=Burkholderia metallica TaxID=488729 RepID=UPI00131B8866|nr:hypothetical protein [Burkholderia metallica]
MKNTTNGAENIPISSTCLSFTNCRNIVMAAHPLSPLVMQPELQRRDFIAQC